MFDETSVRRFSADIRIATIRSLEKAGFGHIGGSMSAADVLAVLYGGEMQLDPAHPDWDGRDYFVLSKGHCGPALYAALALKGYFPMDWLSTINQPGTHLPSHCDRNKTPGIDMTTGSLGQGFSAAMGMAMAGKMDKKDLTVFTVVGDGESQEGQIWEAAMFAGGKKLDNIVAFTDYNNMQIDGYLEEVNGLYPLKAKWESFGWYVQEVDGHDCKAISQAIDLARKTKGMPHMILLHTIKGKGIYFAENKVSSHNMPVTEEMWKQAVAEIEGGQEA